MINIIPVKCHYFCVVIVRMLAASIVVDQCQYAENFTTIFMMFILFHVLFNTITITSTIPNTDGLKNA